MADTPLGPWVVAADGQVTAPLRFDLDEDQHSAPQPNDEDRRRARLLAEGGNFAPDAEDLFAQGIAVARSGGDVRAFLRERLHRG